jgi:hypothetical protein
MKPNKPRSPQPTVQLNLPLLSLPASVVPEDKQAELVVALVELLTDAAHVCANAGGDDESETHR